jgi:hypothetical protein
MRLKEHEIKGNPFINNFFLNAVNNKITYFLYDQMKFFVKEIEKNLSK